jgi:hypothetical protein
MTWRDALSILGFLLLVALFWVPWGSLIDLAKEEIKSKPRKDVI